MTARYFVILGAMRTGSNLLEETLATLPGVTTWGEFFNPHFIGKPGREEALGLTLKDRDADPIAALDRMREASEGLPGLRLFHDHDPRVLRHVLTDPRALIVVLTRNPLESWASLAAARKTGQWWLSDMRAAKETLIEFDPLDFARYAEDLAEFHGHVRRATQACGRPPFIIDYKDLGDSDVLRGLTRYLGQSDDPNPEGVRAKVQNPRPLEDRFTNASAVRRSIADLSAPDLLSPRNLTDRIGPGVREFVVLEDARLLYMPVRGTGEDALAQALLARPGAQVGLTQAALRQWMRDTPGHVAVTWVRDPLTRARDAFETTVLPTGGPRADIRAALQRRHGLELPEQWPDPEFPDTSYSEAFLGFLSFLEGNLAGQSSIRTDNGWRPQAQFVAAMSSIRPPDLVLRDETVEAQVSRLVGREIRLRDSDVRRPDSDALRRAAFRAYRRDYLTFGFQK